LNPIKGCRCFLEQKAFALIA